MLAQHDKYGKGKYVFLYFWAIHQIIYFISKSLQICLGENITIME